MMTKECQILWSRDHSWLEVMNVPWTRDFYWQKPMTHKSMKCHTPQSKHTDKNLSDGSKTLVMIHNIIAFSSEVLLTQVQLRINTSSAQNSHHSVKQKLMYLFTHQKQTHRGFDKNYQSVSHNDDRIEFTVPLSYAEYHSNHWCSC